MVMLKKLRTLKKLKKLKSIFLLCAGLLSLFSLSGCASLNSSFDCKKPPLVMCKSLDEVNTMVNRGELGRFSEDADCPTCSQSFKNADSPVAKTTPIPTGNFTTPYPVAALNLGAPLRYGETVMRLWVAPYQDTNGNYYSPSELYTVVKPGHWMGYPPIALTTDED